MTSPPTTTTQLPPRSPLSQALQQQQEQQQQQPPGTNKRTVTAQVVACDHYRIHGGLAVESDYIIQVQIDGMESFYLSKTYVAFCSFVHELRIAASQQQQQQQQQQQGASAKKNNHNNTPLQKYLDAVTQLVDSQRTRYLGKVNYMYVKLLARERQEMLDRILEATLQNYRHADERVAACIEQFFLTDHCSRDDDDDDDDDGIDYSVGLASIRHRSVLDDSGKYLAKTARDIGHALGFTASRERSGSSSSSSSMSVVVPLSRCERRSSVQRSIDDRELSFVGDAPHLLLDNDGSPTEWVPSYRQPRPVVQTHTSIGTMIDTNPLAFLVIFAACVAVLIQARVLQIRLDGDIALLCIFASYCLGLNTPRPMMGGYDRPSAMLGAIRTSTRRDKSGRKLLRRSIQQSNLKVVDMIMSEHGDDDDDGGDQAQTDHAVPPMARFPDGAPIGSHNNAWSPPSPTDFLVRGPDYFVTKKKVESGPCIFPCRGVDLFLTDKAPGNVGRNPLLFGAKLREKPTFIINFRLPWGILLFYYEIPERFLPLIRAAYDNNDDDDDDKKETRKSDDDDFNSLLDAMSPGERTVGRFLLADESVKNSTLKIVPVVIDGPWVVKSIVGGKPAIIGNKLPVQYHYSPATDDDGSSLYLEADLDIAASSAARGILSVTRSYTQILTLNLGFVVQANQEDELPEQMLVGTRCHGIDPLTAPAYPEQDDVRSMMKATAESNSN